MDSLESKLGEILSSPEKMEQVMKIAGELLGSGAFSAENTAANAPEESAPASGGQAGGGSEGASAAGLFGSTQSGLASSGGAPDLSSALPAIMSMLGSANSSASNSGGESAQSSSTVSGGNPLGGLGNLGGLDPRFMSAAMQVLGALGKDDDSTRLLRALRPHLREERCERLDRAVQIMRISGAIRAAIHSFSGGAGNVQQI